MTPFFSTSRPLPTFTSASIIDLSTKVYIITSLNPGTLHLARILYNLHATIYFGCPSLVHFNSAADKLQKACPESKGRLEPFLFDAAVSKSFGTAVNEFSEQEWRLDVLFLDTSGDDLLVAYALAKLLVPVLHTTASHFCHPNPSIRVVWMAPTSSLPSTSSTPGLSAADEVYLLAYAFSRLPLPPTSMREDPPTHTLPNSNPSGVQHVCVTAELEQSKLQRSIQRFVPAMLDDKSEQSACTMLYAALGPDVRSGDWVVPRGRKSEKTEHVRQVLAGKDGKAESVSATIYSYCEKRLEKCLDR